MADMSLRETFQELTRVAPQSVQYRLRAMRSLGYNTNLVGKTQGNMQIILGQAPKLHLLWVQHIARLRDESVPDLYIYRHLLEAKSRILHLGGTPRHEGMNVISILIIPVCIGNRTSAHSRGGG